MGILLFTLKCIRISLLLKMINGFSWPAQIMASPFNIPLSRIRALAWKRRHIQGVRREHQRPLVHPVGLCPGGTHIFGWMELCRSNGSLFCKKSLNMGPVFYQKILKHGSTFLTRPQIFGFLHGETPKNRKISEKWAYFSRKNLKNGYPFLPKSPLKMGRGFEAQAAHPCPTQIWVPPRGSICWQKQSNQPVLANFHRVQKFT